MPLSVSSTFSSASSSSDRDSELSDQSLRDCDYQQRNARLLVEYFRTARERYKLLRNQKTWQKFTLAVVDARLALVGGSWTHLLEGVKALDDALSAINPSTKLNWRQPILNRLRTDIARSVPVAMQDKRRIPANEARSLSILKQKLSKGSLIWHTRGQEESDSHPSLSDNLSMGDQVVIHSFELALLLSSDSLHRHVLQLSNLKLTELPALLRKIPELAKHYEQYEGLSDAAHVVDTLDLRSNSLSTLPMWLPEALPKLRCLFVSDNPMALSPAVTALQDLELFDVEDQLYLTALSEKLVQQALRAASNQSELPFVPPLTLLCAEKVRKAGYTPPDETLVNFKIHWEVPRYSCAGCDETIFSGDPRYLPTQLRERYFHFHPPLTKLTGGGQFPAGTARTGRIVSSPEWTFCAPCLLKHCTGAVEDSLGGCMCIACTAARKAWQDRQAIRWTKIRIPL